MPKFSCTAPDGHCSAEKECPDGGGCVCVSRTPWGSGGCGCFCNGDQQTGVRPTGNFPDDGLIAVNARNIELGGLSYLIVLSTGRLLKVPRALVKKRVSLRYNKITLAQLVTRLKEMGYELELKPGRQVSRASK